MIINENKNWIKDQDLTFVASEADNYALEEALRLKEKHDGEVVVISMGGEEAARVLRSGLAMGADRAIHLLDPKFKGSDEFATAATLARKLSRRMAARICSCGCSIRRPWNRNDGNDDGGVSRATRMRLSSSELKRCGQQTLKARRELEGGIIETVELPMPAMLTIQFGINQPRYASSRESWRRKRRSSKSGLPRILDSPTMQLASEGAMYEVKEVSRPRTQEQGGNYRPERPKKLQQS